MVIIAHNLGFVNMHFPFFFCFSQIYQPIFCTFYVKCEVYSQEKIVYNDIQYENTLLCTVMDTKD